MTKQEEPINIIIIIEETTLVVGIWKHNVDNIEERRVPIVHEVHWKRHVDNNRGAKKG